MIGLFDGFCSAYTLITSLVGSIVIFWSTIDFLINRKRRASQFQHMEGGDDR